MPDLLKTLDPAALRARATGRAYWRVRYRDGRIVNEWDGCDWSLLPRAGMIAVRLYCPNGQIAELGNSVDASDRLFQLKGATLAAGRGSRTDFQLIGIVTGTDGQCQCVSWEYNPGRLVKFNDNVWQMRYAVIGRLAFDRIGIRPD